MPRRRAASTPKYPAYCHDRTTDRAYVRIDGRKVYLGPHGSPESRTLYQRTVTVDEWVGAGRPRGAPDAAAAAGAVYTVPHLIVDFWRHAEGVYPAARRTEGFGSELDNFRDALRPLAELYADATAATTTATRGRSDWPPPSQ